MPSRRPGPRHIAVLGITVLACLLFALVIAPDAEHAANRQVNSVLLVPHRSDRQPRGDLVVVRTPLGTCESRLERQSHRLPAVAIVGASYTAGVGPGSPQLSWAVDLARLLRWNAVVYGVPGAGYANDGTDGRGPVARMLDDVQLGQLSPGLVIIQAGRDDSDVPPAREEQRVRADIELIKARDPRARIALITSFAGPAWSPPPSVHAINRAIVTAARSADPGVIIINPLADRWQYARANADDTLHPDASGDSWIAGRVASILHGYGIAPAAVSPATPLICDVAVGVGQPTTMAA